MIKFFAGYTARAAYKGGVGSRVLNVEAFEASLAQAVEGFDFSTENPNVRTEGQGFFPLSEAVEFVSAGVGPRSSNPLDYVLRQHRGEVKAFLSRKHAVKAETLAVVVYTVEAYLAALNGPDTSENVAQCERALLAATDATHVIVAVLAGAGPEAFGPGRLVSNLAGGNKDAATWTADEIRQKATEAQAYASEWSVVSD